MSKQNNAPPPGGSLVLTPAALGFAAAMLVVGGVVGFFVGQGGNSEPAPVVEKTGAVEEPGSNAKVVNNTNGQLRRLSPEEKAELLAKRDKDSGKKPTSKKKDAGEPPPDSPMMQAKYVGELSDAVLLDEYKRAVAFLAAGNARSAKPSLTKLEKASQGTAWREPVLAMLADARAATGEVTDARTLIQSFRGQYKSSEFLAMVQVAEGKAFMQEGKRAKIGQKKGGNNELNAEQKALYAKAIAAFDKAIAQHAGDPALAAAYLNKSSLQVELGELDEAERAAIQLSVDFPSYANAARALNNVGRAAMDKGDYEMAERALQRLIDTFPRDRMASSARNQIATMKLLGKEGPEFAVEEWLGDGPASVSDLKGKPTVLVFWATWCPHCRREMPNVEERFQKYKDKVNIIAVTRNTRGQTTDKVREYIGENGLSFPIAIDPGETSRAYGVSGIPAAAMLDKDGKVVFRNHPARLSDDMIEKYL